MIVHSEDESPVVAYFDGLTEPNPGGTACGGFVVVPHASEAAWTIPLEGSACFGSGEGMTNNVAEYQAALVALRAIYRAGWRGAVILRGDSQLVCRQYSGQYACNAPLLVPLLARLHKAGECFASLRLEWVPREENEMADLESRRAYREATGREAPVRVKVAS